MWGVGGDLGETNPYCTETGVAPSNDTENIHYTLYNTSIYLHYLSPSSIPMHHPKPKDIRSLERSCCILPYTLQLGTALGNIPTQLFDTVIVSLLAECKHVYGHNCLPTHHQA